MVGVIELESMTSTMSTWRSNQLSYTPFLICHIIYAFSEVFQVDFLKKMRFFAFFMPFLPVNEKIPFEILFFSENVFQKIGQERQISRQSQFGIGTRIAADFDFDAAGTRGGGVIGQLYVSQLTVSVADGPIGKDLRRLYPPEVFARNAFGNVIC